MSQKLPWPSPCLLGPLESIIEKEDGRTMGVQWAYNESVSQVRFAPELLKDPDPTGVDTPVRWKWQCSKSQMCLIGEPDWLVLPMK